MEIVTLEYTIKYGDKKECVVLYFKDKESAEKYKKENLEDDPNITLEEDAIGISYYYHDDWYNEINEMAVDKAWSRLNPPVAPGAERVVERIVERDPEFFKVVYFNHFNVRTCRLLRSEDALKDYMVKVMEVAVGAVEVIKMSLDQLVEEYENA